MIKLQVSITWMCVLSFSMQKTGDVLLNFSLFISSDFQVDFKNNNVILDTCKHEQFLNACNWFPVYYYGYLVVREYAKGWKFILGSG